MASAEMKETLRAKHMAESFAQADKLWRHGLFSGSASHAIGETNKYAPTEKRVDPESGEHLYDPINFYSGPLKRGPGQYMSDPSFVNLALGDPYLAVKPSSIRKFKRNTYTTGGHEVDWRPAK